MRIAGIALGSVLLGIGLVQPSLAQQEQSGRQPGNQDQLQSENSGQSTARGDYDDWASRRERMRAWHMHEGMGPMWRNRFARETNGAHFRLRRGQALVDVKCPENDSLQSCVNAISQLLDKVRAIPAQSNSPTNGTGGVLDNQEDSTSSQHQ